MQMANEIVTFAMHFIIYNQAYPFSVYEIWIYILDFKILSQVNFMQIHVSCILIILLLFFATWSFNQLNHVLYSLIQDINIIIFIKK